MPHHKNMKLVPRSEINEMLRKRQGERSLREYAKTIDMSVAYLSDVLRGNREPGPRILKMLKLRKQKTTEVTYESLP